MVFGQLARFSIFECLVQVAEEHHSYWGAKITLAVGLRNKSYLQNGSHLVQRTGPGSIVVHSARSFAQNVPGKFRNGFARKPLVFCAHSPGKSARERKLLSHDCANKIQSWTGKLMRSSFLQCVCNCTKMCFSQRQLSTNSSCDEQHELDNASVE